jgi:hypothetical protein
MNELEELLLYYSQPEANGEYDDYESEIHDQEA